MNVAITGGIGSGKSFVCSLLRKKGIDVYDCDNAAKQIMRRSASVRKRLQSLIGSDAYIGGLPNKPVIASFVLASDENANKVNAIVHPAVAEDFKNSGMQFMECAILFSSGFNKFVDRVVCVTAPLEVRIDRIMKRDSISCEKAREWIDCQMPQGEIAALSDYVIENDGLKPVDTQIDSLLDALGYQR